MRYWLLGRPGDGKTNFVSSNPRALIIDMEDSARDVISPKAHRVYCPNMAKVMEIVKLLVEDSQSAQPSYEHVVFDTVDSVQDKMLDHMTNQFNLGREDKVDTILYSADGRSTYDRLKALMMGILSAVFDHGYGWTCTGHVKEKDIQRAGQPTVTEERASVYPSTAQALHKDCQIHAYMETVMQVEKIPTGKTQRVGGKDIPLNREVSTRLFRMDLRGAVRYGTKLRYGEFLPDYLDLKRGEGWAQWVAILDDAQQRAASEAS